MLCFSWSLITPKTVQLILPGRGRRIYYLLSLYTRFRKGKEPTTTDGQHCTAMRSATIHVINICTVHMLFLSPRKVHETLASMDFNSFTEYYKKKRCSKVEETRVVHHFRCCTRIIVIWLISVPQQKSASFRFCETCFETLSECRKIWLMLAF